MSLKTWKWRSFLDVIGCNDQFLIYADALPSHRSSLLLRYSRTSSGLVRRPQGVLLRDRVDVVRSAWISLAELKEWYTSSADDGMDILAGPSDAFQVPLARWRAERRRHGLGARRGGGKVGGGRIPWESTRTTKAIQLDTDIKDQTLPWCPRSCASRH